MSQATPPISESSQERPHARPGADLGGEEKFHAEVDEAAELKRRLLELKSRFVPLWDNFVGLVVAQTRLTKAQLQERTRLFFARGIILIHVWFCAVIAWVFLNYAIWRGVSLATMKVANSADSTGIPALVIFGIHAVVILILIKYYRSLRL